MKINLNKNLLDLEGKDLPDSNLGKLVGQLLSQSNEGDALKLWDWARKLYSGKELDLDPSDTQTFEAFIKANKSLTVLAKAQILELLTSAKV